MSKIIAGYFFYASIYTRTKQCLYLRENNKNNVYLFVYLFVYLCMYLFMWVFIYLYN